MSVAATRPGSASLSAHQWTVEQRLEGSRSVEHVDLSASPQRNVRPSELCSHTRESTSPTPLFRIITAFSVLRAVSSHAMT